MTAYPNIEKRQFRTTYPDATYFGWDARGRPHYIGKGKVRGNLWWAVARDDPDKTVLFGNTLREISIKLATKT